MHDPFRILCFGIPDRIAFLSSAVLSGFFIVRGRFAGRNKTRLMLFGCPSHARLLGIEALTEASVFVLLSFSSLASAIITGPFAVDVGAQYDNCLYLCRPKWSSFIRESLDNFISLRLTSLPTPFSFNDYFFYLLRVGAKWSLKP